MWNNAVQHLSFSPDLARPDSRSTLGVDSSLHSLVLRILVIIHVHLSVPWIEDYY